MLIGALIFASFVTLFVTARLWAEIFWKNTPTAEAAHPDLFDKMNPVGKMVLVSPVVLLATISLFIGLGAEHAVLLSRRIAQELIDPLPYINAVLGEYHSKL
jgi:multicomponent Na+:H+ antiporter subunit D